MSVSLQPYIIPVLAKSKISQLEVVPVAKQAGLNVTWSQMPEDRFSRDVAHVHSHPSDARTCTVCRCMRMQISAVNILFELISICMEMF